MTNGLSFRQTDTAAPCGALIACSSAVGFADVTANRLAVRNGTPGTGAFTVGTLNASTAPDNEAALFFQAQPRLEVWQAGDYRVSINVVAGGNNNCQIIGAHICRLDRLCGTLMTVGSFDLPPPPPVAYILMSAGVIPINFENVGPSNGGEADDLYFVLRFRWLGTGNQRFRMIADQLIETPIVAPPAPDVAPDIHAGRSAQAQARAEAADVSMARTQARR